MIDRNRGLSKSVVVFDSLIKLKWGKYSSKFLLNISRTRLKKYAGIVTGHFGFNKHLTTIRKRTDPSCDLCGEHMETAEHFFCNCPAFITARRKHLGCYFIRYNLIKSLNPKDILNYITSTGRYLDVILYNTAHKIKR